MKPRRNRQAAFTLIEILVALAVFAALGGLAYGALGPTQRSAELLNDRLDRLQSVQRAVRIMSQDFMQLAPRPVRDELGDNYGPALYTDYQSNFAIELTTGGWSNPIGLPRATLQRAAYRLEEDELVRYYWRVLDRTLSNEPVSRVLLDDVEEIRFRFLTDSGDWVEQWPPSGAQGPPGLPQRPRAVEILLRLTGEGEISRLLEVAP